MWQYAGRIVTGHKVPRLCDTPTIMGYKDKNSTEINSSNQRNKHTYTQRHTYIHFLTSCAFLEMWMGTLMFSFFLFFFNLKCTSKQILRAEVFMCVWVATAVVRYSLRVKSSAGWFPSSALTHWQRARLITSPPPGGGASVGVRRYWKIWLTLLWTSLFFSSSACCSTHKRAMSSGITIFFFLGFLDESVNAKHTNRRKRPTQS